MLQIFRDIQIDCLRRDIMHDDQVERLEETFIEGQPLRFELHDLPAGRRQGRQRWWQGLLADVEQPSAVAALHQAPLTHERLAGSTRENVGRRCRKALRSA